MAILRNIAVIAVLLLALQGAFEVIRGDRVPQLRADIEASNTAMQTSITIHTEAEAFAENFMKDYLSYGNRETDKYRKRLEQYCSPRLATEIAENLLLRGDANAVYVRAVNASEYGPNQYDISVVADVVYTKQTEPAKDPVTGILSAPQAVVTRKTLHYIVPLYSDGYGGYAVEDIPRLSAPIQAASYSRQEYTGVYADEADKAAAQQMLNDFVRTMFTESQNKIDYYLASDADKSKFRELMIDGSFEFLRIENISLFKTSASNEFLALVSMKMVDINGTEIRQRFNIQLEKRDKFYAKDINSRTYSIQNQ